MSKNSSIVSNMISKGNQTSTPLVVSKKKNETARISLVTTKEMKAALKEKCKKLDDIPMNEAINQLIKAWLEAE